MDDETPDSEENLSVVTNERHIEDKKHVGTKEQPTEYTTDTMRKRSEVANEHLRIADRAFVAYVESLDESEGIIALTNYRKALSLAKKNGLFSKSQREKIEQCINVLEEELELY